MKTIKESIIGRKGVLTFGVLKSGQIVMMKNREMFMYLNYKDADSIHKISDQIQRSRDYGYDFTFGGFFYENEVHSVEFMPSGSYTMNLKHKKSNHEWDIECVSEQVFKIGLYKEHQLKEMSQKTEFLVIK